MGNDPPHMAAISQAKSWSSITASASSSSILNDAILSAMSISLCISKGISLARTACDPSLPSSSASVESSWHTFVWS